MKTERFKRYFLSFILTLIFISSILMKTNSQTLIEGGPFLGISWYNGDLNPQRLFYNNYPAFGGFLRYVVDDRLSFKGSVTVGKISGEYPAKNVLIREFDIIPYEFERNITDIALTFEINMFSFDHPNKKSSNFSPYLSLGLGTIFYKSYINNNEKQQIVLSLPFGAGVKYKVIKGLRVGMEWTMRKSFADDLDLVGFNNSINPNDPYGFEVWKLTHNNDWVSFVGVFVSFTIINRREKCNAGYY